ncbi:benzoate transporter [Pseudobacillus wudalianchiensis]|uniref:Benzoate transporter n=1 Tax=Pseudobacillus wudalianchiensis TaxID=1743143 RepID=A0A1B9ATH7_9BACI|nr:benzoate transporter [Bacillus wudalianchiensis]OCA87163.1 benzoate transporter [Bacillus wudalianchiensis]
MRVIHEGRLSTNNQAFTIVRLSMEHIDLILELQQVVIETLENKDILQPLSYEEFQYILEGKGLMVGTFADKKLIAFRALLVPPLDEEHLGRDIGLTEEELSSVIYQEISNVHPHYRGNGLQKLLAQCIMKELETLDQQYKYVCCTVAPFNIPSLKDKFAQGMEMATLKEKYGSRLRYVFVKELREDRTEKEWEFATSRMDDTTGQQELFKQGWKGFRMENREGIQWVDFRRGIQ